MSGLDRPRSALADLLSRGRAALAGLLLAVVWTGCGGGGGGGGGTGPSNTPPTASIDSPVDEANVDEGVTIDFQGSASDSEDGSLSGSALVWESDLDGQIGTGATVSTSGLSQGHHVVTLTATDSEGATDSDQIGVRVRPPGQSITVDLTIGDNFFEDLQGRRNEDAFVRVRLGDTVRWTYGQGGAVTHNVVSGEGTNGTDGDGVPAGASSSIGSPNLRGGDSYSFTPDAEGTWTYYCDFHPTEMFDSVIEVEP